MNKRIQELMLLAGTDTSGKWMGVEHAEKFAELIVRECIAQCEQVATAADAKSKSKFVTDDGRMLHEGMWGGAKNCSGQIKQHFGVAE
jgi:hypothetical protein